MSKATGVIVARFQTPYLHQGHKDIIEFVQAKHNRVVIILGVNELKGSKRNPYDFYTRERMVKQAYPNLIVLPCPDHPSDEAWSKNLDHILLTTFSNQTFCLYGSRDSFAPYYSGKFPTAEFPETGNYNASEIRYEIADKVRESEDFRAGINYAFYNAYSKVYPTVDVAVFRNNKTQILLGKKVTLDQWRFIGGFVDPTDADYESAGKRELHEECGPIEVGPFHYEKSFRVDDWRYRKEEDKIITTLFSTEHSYGEPTPMDDIVETAWIDFDQLPTLKKEGKLVAEHLPLFEHLMTKYLHEQV